MTIRKSIISLVLTLCLAAGFAAMPVSAHAAGSGRAIQPGTACVADGNYLYFGTNSTQWRVLNATYTNTGAAGMFLLAEGTLGNTVFEAAWDSDEEGQTKPNDWQGSDAQAWCNNNFYSIFTSAEQEAVISVSKPDSEADLYSIHWGASSLNNEYLFFLSAQEAATYLGANVRDPGLVSSSDWWLRSPYAYNVNIAGIVNADGLVDDVNVYNDLGARPAFNLNLNSVLFTSAAEGGKSSGAEGTGAISEISAYTGSAWKVTLLDSSRDGFSAKTTANNSGVLTVEYSGAAAGGNNKISAIIADSSGAYTHYGRLAAASADGSVKLDISGIDMNGKTLYIFNEQYNGDKMTDLSSKLVEVEVPDSISNPYGVPSTGDNSNIPLWSALFVAFAAVALFTAKKKEA